MEERQEHNNILSKAPKWMKNPFVLIGAAIVVIVIIYFLAPYFKSLESPFTQYNPLPIDSTYIKLDTTSKANPVDTTVAEMDTIESESIENTTTSSDTSSIADLFRLNTDYDELDPNEQLNRNVNEIPDDLFSRLILANLEPEQIELINDINLNIGLKSMLQILSSTAVEMLSGTPSRYHMNILEAIEQTPVIQGVMITGLGEKVIYATNRKLLNQYLFELFPRHTLSGNQLIIEEFNNLQFISMPVHHQYGKIGTIILILKQ